MKQSSKQIKQYLSIVIITAVLASVVTFAAVKLIGGNTPIDQAQTDTSSTKESCVADDCLSVSELEYPAGALPSSVQEALSSALDDENKARATYAAILEEYPDRRPFAMIIRAEEKHIASLKALYDKYSLPIPADQYIANKPAIADSFTGNCTIGVQAEIDNVNLYKQNLLPAAEGYDDVTAVFMDLMNASEQKHLPAFQRCAN